jgi:Tfp pilus assembly protein PilV
MAMSLVLGVWMTSVGVYQALVLRLMQQESKRMHLSFDAYELAEQARVNRHKAATPNISSKDVRHESSRVSSRNRPL